MTNRRRPLRRARKWLVSRVTDASLRYARHLPDAGLAAIDTALHRLLPRLAPVSPIFADVIRRNMMAAGVYRAGALSAYFEQVAGHLTGALHIFRRAAAAGGNGHADGVRELARRRIHLDDTIRHVHDARREDRGVILAAVHACQFLLALARVNEEAPLTVYLRYSRNERGRAAKAAWCQACGLDMIAERSKPTDPAARAATLAAALAEKRVLVITPDIAQRLDKGITARLFGREVSMASGVAALSVLTGAPVVPVTGRLENGRNVVVFHPALHAPDMPHRRGWRRRALEALQQQWADVFAAFVRDYPELWWMWLDNRWTRVFRGDPKYTRPIPE